MPIASMRPSPKRSDSGPVTKNWVKPATAPTAAKQTLICCGPQPNRDWPQRPKVLSIPVNANPTRKVSSINRPITGLPIASPIADQRLGR